MTMKTILSHDNYKNIEYLILESQYKSCFNPCNRICIETSFINYQSVCNNGLSECYFETNDD